MSLPGGQISSISGFLSSSNILTCYTFLSPVISPIIKLIFLQYYLQFCSAPHVQKTGQIWTCPCPQFVSAALELPPICKDPKIASQLCVPAGISLRDSVRSACGMRRQALRLWLDAYHCRILLLADGMTFTLSAWDAIAGRGGSDGTFPWCFWFSSHL